MHCWVSKMMMPLLGEILSLAVPVFGGTAVEAATVARGAGVAWVAGAT